MQNIEQLKLVAVDLTHDGLGVAKIEDYPFFIPGLLPGEVALCVVKERRKNYGKAEIIEILESSPYRVRPICSKANQCGGCEIMHLDYSMQIQFKKKKVEETMKRIGKLNNFVVNEVVKMDNPYYYRNKIQVPFAELKGKTICGYYQKKSHEIVPLSQCFIQPPLFTNIVIFIKNLCNELNITSYNEELKNGILRYVVLRKNYLQQIMIILVTTRKEINQLTKLVEKITNRYPEVISIIQCINKDQGNVVLTNENYLLSGQKHLLDVLCGLQFKISYQSFFQINHQQTEKLYLKVLEYVEPHQNSIILDNYCGVGTISLLLAKHAKFVYGIEIVAEAIKNAQENARLNKITNVEFITGKVEDYIADFLDKGVTTIVLDPPRKGLEKEVIDCIIKNKIKRIVYVSCDVASLARDINLLSNEYIVEKMTIVDMFCHTSSIESIVLLNRK